MAKYTFKQLADMNIFDAAEIAEKMSDDERNEVLASITDSEKASISQGIQRGDLREAIKRTPE
jgi:Mg/Co/Ni transporter MgtE